MLEYQKKEFIINGKKTLILAGEVHYFRLPRVSWEKHLELLKETGCNTVASYVPWICHEENKGEFDFKDHLDIAYFLKLCKEKGLYVFLRPGPFIMAEMKNEGIPYFVYEKYPETIPSTFDDKKVSTKTLDYLHPAFLSATKNWYEALYKQIFPYLIQNSGPIIGIQLDNEVGMLSWVSNSPDLTDLVISDFKDYLKNNNLLLPEDYDFKRPDDSHIVLFHKYLMDYMRYRYQKFMLTLKSYWVDLGVNDMFYFVNIHGTSAGHGYTFPIGISQLIDTYYQNDLIPGNDVYFGNFDIQTFNEQYILNAFLDATTNSDKPTSTLEFNCGSGDFGDNFGNRNMPSASDFKLRMSLFQNQRMINYYLLTGGINYKLKYPRNDDNNRIAFTGERHGFAAPIQPDGSKNYTYERLAYSTNMFNNINEKLTMMKEEYDGLKIGFIMDYFAVEYTYPESQIIKDIHQEIKSFSTGVYWNTVIKQLLLLNYNFTAIYLEKETLNPETTPLLVLGVTKYLSEEVQSKLVNYHKSGGKLFLIGKLPEYDLEGNECPILIDYLGIKPKNIYYDWVNPYLSLQFTDDYQLYGEFRTFYAETIETDKKTIMRDVKTGEKLGIMDDNLIYITSDYPGNLDITGKLMKHLSAKPKYQIEGNIETHLFQRIKNDKETFIQILNLDAFDKKITVLKENIPLFSGKELDLFSQDGYMLPININLNGIIINYSTAEIYNYDKKGITFRLTQGQDEISATTKNSIATSKDYNLIKKGDTYFIKSNLHAKLYKFMTVYFE